MQAITIIYGVVTLTANEVVISGFYDSSTIQKGVLRWSHDGGQTWTSDLSFVRRFQRHRQRHLHAV